MNKKIIYLVLGMVLLAGIVVAGSGIIAKDEVINVRLDPSVKAWADTNVKSISWEKDMITNDGANYGKLTYKIYRGGDYRYVKDIVWLYNDSEVKTTAEALLNERMALAVKDRMNIRYNDATGTGRTQTVPIGQKNVTLT